MTNEELTKLLEKAIKESEEALKIVREALETIKGESK